MVIHPASTTHHRVEEQALRAAGIGPGLVRLSIGLEDPKDLLSDLKGLCGRLRKPWGKPVKMNSTAIRFYSTGSGKPADNAPTLVFVHGAGFDHSIWVMPARYLRATAGGWSQSIYLGMAAAVVLC